MTILDRKLIRDLRQSWQMLLAVSCIIGVGISCYISMMSASRNLEFARTSYYSACRLADFWIDLKKIPVQEVERLAGVPGVSEIRDRIQFKITLDFEDVPRPLGAMVISLPDVQEPVINDIILRTGTYFTPGRANEVIVSEKFAAARNIEPGDTLTAIINNQKKELVVTGTAISAEFVYMTSPGSMVDEPGSYGLLYLKRSFAEDVFGFNGAANSVIGLLAPEIQDEAEAVVDKLNARFDQFGVFAGIPRKQQFSPLVLDGELTQLRNMAYIFPMFFLVVATLVLNVLMLRLAEQQRTVIGTLKAMGYQNGVLQYHFIKFAVAAGVSGGVMGCLLGYVFSGAMTRMYIIYFSFPELTNQFYPDLMIMGLFISILFAVLGTVRGVRRIMSMEPAEAMREAAPQASGAILLERVARLWRRLDAQWQMILRGLFRNKGRTAIAIFSATMGSTIVVLAFGFVDSMDLMIDSQFKKVLTSDYHLTFNSELDQAVLDEVNRLPGVYRVEPVFTLPCTFRSDNHRKKGAVMGISPLGRLTRPVNVEQVPVTIPPVGLLMSDRLMEQLGVQTGGAIELIPVKGERRPVIVPVTQRIQSTMGLAVYADYHWLNSVLSQQDIVTEVRVLVSHNNREKKEFLSRIRGMAKLETLTDLGEQEKALNKQFDGAMRAMAVMMIFFAGVIFFGAILNGTLIAISERRREMATLRTMGYYNYEVGRLFLRENLLTNIIGTLFGLPLGYWLLVSSMKAFETDAYSFPASLSNASYVYTLLLAVLFVLLSHLFVIKKLRGQNWVEAMSLKE